MMLSLYSVLPSIMPETGLENHSLNSRCEANTCGMRKCISDHSSIRLFCSGVPVSSRRLPADSNTEHHQREDANQPATTQQCD